MSKESKNRNNSAVVKNHNGIITPKADKTPVVVKISLKDRLEQALQNRNVQKALHSIRQAEHNHSNETDIDDTSLYSISYGNKHIADLSDHPANKLMGTKGQIPSGAYQIQRDTWNEAKVKLELTDFCAHNQDLAALYIINRTGKLTNIENGEFLQESTLSKLGIQWAALPVGQNKLSHYEGQMKSCMTYDTLKKHYDHY